MLSRGSIQFYINGPPPIAKAETHIFPVNFQAPKPSYFTNNSSANDSIEPQDLNSLVNKTQNALLTIRSIRIFDFFPDKLIIDENKVSFIYNNAFGVKSIHSVLIENITYVEAHTSLMTGCLVVIDSSNYRHPIELRIDNLRKNAAIRARKLIQGLVHAKTQKVDISHFNPHDLENNLEQLGMVMGED